MRIPRYVAQMIATSHSLGFPVDSDGEVLAWPRGQCVYPPVGYLEWDILQVGNGDSYGYYWPVGCEDADPLVCTTEHDASVLRPIASDLQGCLRAVYTTEPGSTDDVRRVAKTFGISLAGLQTYGELDHDPEESLAVLDPHSPQLLMAAACKANRSGDLDTAVHYLQLALDLLPEYAEASLRLAQIHQRNRDLASAAAALLSAVASPLCFGGYATHLECLQNLQRMRDVQMPDDVLADPLWQMRHRLSLQIGRRLNDDIAAWEEVIAAYHNVGQGVLAVRLRMLLGELLSFEPVSLQRRYEWTDETQREKLRKDLVRANLQIRLVATN